MEATGELYVVQAGDPQTGGGHVEVLAVTDRATIESALEGRPERPSLAWIRRRVARLPRLKQIQMPANVHFTPEGSKILAQQVVGSILQALPAGKQ